MKTVKCRFCKREIKQSEAGYFSGSGNSQEFGFGNYCDDQECVAEVRSIANRHILSFSYYLPPNADHEGDL